MSETKLSARISAVYWFGDDDEPKLHFHTFEIGGKTLHSVRLHNRSGDLHGFEIVGTAEQLESLVRQLQEHLAS